MEDRGPKLQKAGGAIRELREGAGLGLNEFAAKLGWDKSVLSRYENGQIALSTEAIETIAKGLGQSPEVVLLKCLQTRYPRLSESEAGKLIEEAIRELEKG